MQTRSMCSVSAKFLLILHVFGVHADTRVVNCGSLSQIFFLSPFVDFPDDTALVLRQTQEFALFFGAEGLIRGCPVLNFV